MTSVSRRTTGGLIAFLALSALAPVAARAQYFGRNKVQYKTFAWRIIQSDHFDNYFYGPESLAVADVARMSERWYTRHSDTFRHAFDRKSLIYYASQADFEQTNVVQEQLEEGTGGVTEGIRTRVIMPMQGIYAENNHVIGHELVHVFQYNIAEAAPGGGLARLNELPLFLIEGMAEYFSLGRDNELTGMWMRDAVMHNRFPTIKQLTTDPRFFPYRYGQALWAYVGGRWGDRAIVDVYRTALRIGWDQSLLRVLGENSDSLSKDWAAANRALYLPIAHARTHPDSLGERIIGLQHKAGDYNVSPSLSPDGNYLAFFSSRNVFGIDLFLADAHTGKIIKKLVAPESDPHFDAISWVQSTGAWSPDAKKFAFIVYANGNNEIAILDIASTNIEKRVKMGEVTSVSHIAWSPDGKTLAVSGLKGGISDLYLVDIGSGDIRQLTNDRNADMQPEWSPDGKTLAFTTDRGAETDFNLMRFSRLQLATIDIATRHISVYSPFPRTDQINPQWSPDGKSLFFVASVEGVADVFRLDPSTGQVYRVTHVATGVSGITQYSPALSVAATSGRMAFTVFSEQGFEVRALEAPDTRGVLMAPSTTPIVDAAILPPGNAPNSIVTAYLNDPVSGLPTGTDFKVLPYHSSFSLDALGQPSVGVASGPFGTGIAGGVSAFFGDQLGDQQIATILQANGTVQDIGGAVEYVNMKHRWNYALGIEHVPYLTGGVFVGDTTVSDGSGTLYQGLTINQVLERIFVDQAQASAYYPFSSTRRMEVGLSATRLGYGAQLQQIVEVNGAVVGTNQSSLPGATPLYYAQPMLAFVSDNSYTAFTSPVDGERWRFQAAPTIGTLQYTTFLADYRKYFFFRPTTVAIRVLHYGNYGKDAESDRLPPLYLGEETLMRGYGWGSFTPDECANTSATQTACPVIDRMFGSRVAVANFEWRIPLFGTPEWGLFNFPFLPTDVSPFFDAGLSWTSTQAPDFRWAQNVNTTPAACANQNQQSQQASLFLYPPIPCADRVPVFSTGLSFRFNFLGYMILEAYIAHPFQRPGKNWVTGFQLAPGW